MKARMITTVLMAGALAASAVVPAQAMTTTHTGVVAHAAGDTAPPIAKKVQKKAATKKVTKKAATKKTPKRPVAKRPAPGTAFTAYGDTFRLTVKDGVLTTEGKRIGERRIKVERNAFAKGVEFTGRDRGREVALVVRSGKCVDTAGQDTGMRASFTYGSRTMRGCAVAGAMPIANT
ncbi:MAG: hypothetical protein Q4G43_05230 [Mobilicoccus sp.]|nr:hypothetical protein [Mobilicoccus sp.]